MLARGGRAALARLPLVVVVLHRLHHALVLVFIFVLVSVRRGQGGRCFAGGTIVRVRVLGLCEGLQAPGELLTRRRTLRRARAGLFNCRGMRLWVKVR